MTSKLPLETDGAISDTSCFILLDKIDALSLLKDCFRTVYTTTVVTQEFGIQLPEWVQVREVVDKNFLINTSKLVDKGEASIIALAEELPDCILILDDDKARKLAKTLDLKFTGTLGILIRAKNLGVIPAIKPFIEKIRATNFHANEPLLNRVLTSVGE
ncbi:DUF3368 domain-containing protein [Larkinella rosea]|uniref:DUF3368 domain-containing protein n=1 Tax=Larkinella rosea TaxID=2025312 RepID=A0A3P1BZC7_9BACT|nr:DUF3368 domain-containing protein [Larkinella rosea]RRB06495.1 DUF3368 domain-containing protein [Larkinella rosea]